MLIDLNDPLFGLGLSVFVFYVTKRLFQWKSIFLFNPLVAAPGVILLLIGLTSVTYDNYRQGGQLLTYLLGPATVALGVPFYKKISLIKRNYKAVLIGGLTASLISAVSVVVMGKLIGLSATTINSMAAKSATGPIAIEVTRNLGGMEQIVILSVTITGIIGGIIGAEVLNTLKVKSRITKGLTLGSSAHAGGTSRALLLGETEGALSGVAMVVTGLLVAIITPLIITLLM